MPNIKESFISLQRMRGLEGCGGRWKKKAAKKALDLRF